MVIAEFTPDVLRLRSKLLAESSILAQESTRSLLKLVFAQRGSGGFDVWLG